MTEPVYDSDTMRSVAAMMLTKADFEDANAALWREGTASEMACKMAAEAIRAAAEVVLRILLDGEATS